MIRNVKCLFSFLVLSLYLLMSLFLLSGCGNREDQTVTVPKEISALYLLPSYLNPGDLESRRYAASLLNPQIDQQNKIIPPLIKVRDELIHLLKQNNIEYPASTYDSLTYKVYNELRRAYLYQGASVVDYGDKTINLWGTRQSTIDRAASFSAYTTNSIASLKNAIEEHINDLKMICDTNHIEYESILNEINLMYTELHKPTIECIDIAYTKEVAEFNAIYGSVDGFDYNFTPEFFDSKCRSFFVRLSNSDKFGLFPEGFSKASYQKYTSEYVGAEKDFYILYDMSRRLTLRDYQLNKAKKEYDIVYKGRDIYSIYSDKDIASNPFIAYYGNNKAVVEEWYPVISPNGRPVSIEKARVELKKSITEYFSLLSQKRYSLLPSVFADIKHHYSDMARFMYSQMTYIHLINAIYTNELDQGL